MITTSEMKNHTKSRPTVSEESAVSASCPPSTDSVSFVSDGNVQGVSGTDGTPSKQKTTAGTKCVTAVALALTAAVILVEIFGFCSVLDEMTANLTALPLLATAALFGGVRSYLRSLTVRSVFATAVFQFATAAILYLCCIVILLIRFRIV